MDFSRKLSRDTCWVGCVKNYNSEKVPAFLRSLYVFRFDKNDSLIANGIWLFKFAWNI